MGFDDIKNKAQGLADQHGDKADSAIDKGSDQAKDRFGHDEQVDSAAQQAKDRLGQNAGDAGTENR